MQQHIALQVWVTIFSVSRWHFQHHHVFISTIAYFGQGKKGFAFRNYREVILSSDSPCHIEIYLSSNLPIYALIFLAFLKLICSFLACAFACYRMHPFCSHWCLYPEWNAMLCYAMHGQRYLIISTFHSHGSL